MKKFKMIGLAATALLTIAPIVSPVAVQAADVAQASTSNAKQATTANSSKQTLPVSIEFTQDGKKQSINPDGMYFQVAKGSNFNPTDFTGSNGSNFKIVAANNQKVTVDSNTVDTSKAGNIGTVKLTAGSTTVTYTVLTTPEGLTPLNLAPRDWVTADLSDVVFSQGDKFYISGLTKIENGRNYTRVFSKPNLPERDGYWIRTEYLCNTNPAPELVKKTVMHKALAYSKGGGSKFRYYKAFQEIYVKSTPVSFDGGQYYQVFEANGNYTSDYLKVGNIDGTKRTLTKNAYVYATSKRRADRTLLRKGTTITTYGGSYRFKNGKRYYRIEGATATNKRYVKVVNFE